MVDFKNFSWKFMGPSVELVVPTVKNMVVKMKILRLAFHARGETVMIAI